MAAPKKTNPSRSLETALPASAYARLEYLAKMGMHGDTAPAVARFLIGEGLARLWREGKIPDELPSGD